MAALATSSAALKIHAADGFVGTCCAGMHIQPNINLSVKINAHGKLIVKFTTPKKLTCPLKIIGWKMYFAYRNSPYLRGLGHFRGCKSLWTLRSPIWHPLAG